MIRRLILMVLLACVGGGLLAGCASSSVKSQKMIGRGMEKTRPDGDPVRRIVLAYPHNSEKIDVTYFHDGGYDKAALAKINQLFRDRRANKVGDIDPELIDYLTDIRKRLGLPQTVVFQILSGYRSPESNEALAQTNGNVAKESMHKYGYAVDFRIPNVNGKAIAEIALTMQRGGVSFYPEDNHVHVDIGNIRTWLSKGSTAKDAL